ncbi:N-acetyl-gamma-glutamyl-phosphate reductase [Exiguobacterium artemiae]
MRCTIVGATGYAAIELIRLIELHPHLEIVSLISDSKTGEKIERLYSFMNKNQYPVLTGFSVSHIKEVETDLLFLATPSGISTEYLKQLTEWDGKTIDLSGDLRLEKTLYEAWYAHDAIDSSIQAQATYGLTEWKREDIKNSRLVANPGCYATAILLGLLPLLEQQMIDPDQIIIHASSGLSGAGKTLTEQTHHVRSNENVRMYKQNRHQHIPEVESVVEQITGQKVVVSLATYLVPLNRGIMATMTLQPLVEKTEHEWQAWFSERYQQESFIRINQADPEIRSAAGSNYCDLSVYLDTRTGRLTVVSVLDNMQKGAAGQAIQNANVMSGYQETLGLTQQPFFI